MIKNEWQLKVSLSKLAELESDPEHSLAVEEILEELRSEISGYRALRSGSIRAIEIENIDELPVALIRARIASGLTQTGFAKVAGLHESVIQKYEAEDYETASLSRVLQLAKVLSVPIVFGGNGTGELGVSGRAARSAS